LEYDLKQIISSVKETGDGLEVAELSRKYGISGTTLYNWKAKYGGMTTNDAKRLKALEDENRKLKQLVADQLLDNRVLKELLSKNF